MSSNKDIPNINYTLGHRGIQSDSSFIEIQNYYAEARPVLNVFFKDAYVKLYFEGWERPPTTPGRDARPDWLVPGRDIVVTISKNGKEIDTQDLNLSVSRWHGMQVVMFRTNGLERGMYDIEIRGYVRDLPHVLHDKFQLEPVGLPEYLIGVCRNKLFDGISSFDRHVDLYNEIIRWDDTQIWDELENARREINLYKATPRHSRGYTFPNMPEDLLAPLFKLACANLLENRIIREVDEAHDISTDYGIGYIRDYSPVASSMRESAQGILERSMKFIRPGAGAAKGHKVRFFEYGLFLGLTCFPPWTKVLTNEGEKFITDVVEGDTVITHNCRERKVTNIMNRRFDGKLNIINIEGVNEAIMATPEHPVLTQRGNESEWIKVEDTFVGSPLAVRDEKNNILTFNPVNSKEYKVYNGFVYNLEVEDDNSYLVNNVAVHNCFSPNVWFV